MLFPSSVGLGVGVCLKFAAAVFVANKTGSPYYRASRDEMFAACCERHAGKLGGLS
jgi:hypothetical protein